MGHARPKEVLLSDCDVGARGGRLALLLALVVGCGDTSGVTDGSGAQAGDSGAGGVGGRVTTASVASVAIDSTPAPGTHLGQRWSLTVTARDVLGDPVGEANVAWSSSDVSVATVSERGVVTALRPGTASITVTSNGHSDAVTVTARSAVPSDVGEMVTTWFARSDAARIAIVDGRLEVFALRSGDPTPPAPWPHPDVAHVAFAGERIGLLSDVVDGLGTFRVLDPHTEWRLLGIAHVRSFQLLDDRIAQLDGDGALRLRQGLDGDWVTVEESGVAEFRLDGERIVILQDDGALRAKDDLANPWTTLATGVRSFVLHDDRIAVLLEEGDGSLQVKDGLDGSWVPLEVRVRQVALSGDRIGVLRKDGVAYVKEGIDGPSIPLASSYVEALELEGDRVAIQFEGGDLRARDGVEGPWTILSTASRRFALRGDTIGMLTEDGELWFKTGLDGEWATIAPSGPVTDWLPFVRVPVPPARTAVVDPAAFRAPCAGLDTWMCPTVYADSRQACVEDGDRCAPAPEPASPFPVYGRFCGADRPLETDWDWAIGPHAGPIDAFDALCMHADRASIWYPNADPSHVEACIIRYGLTFARLTRDGDALEPGTSDYSDIIDRLGNLGDAIRDEEPYASACEDDAFEAFIDATRVGQ